MRRAFTSAMRPRCPGRPSPPGGVSGRGPRSRGSRWGCAAGAVHQHASHRADHRQSAPLRRSDRNGQQLANAGHPAARLGVARQVDRRAHPEQAYALQAVVPVVGGVPLPPEVGGQRLPSRSRASATALHVDGCVEQPWTQVRVPAPPPPLSPIVRRVYRSWKGPERSASALEYQRGRRFSLSRRGGRRKARQPENRGRQQLIAKRYGRTGDRRAEDRTPQRGRSLDPDSKGRGPQDSRASGSETA